MHNTAFNVLRGRGLIVGFVIMMIISISGNNKWGNNDCVMWVDVSQLGECQDIDWQSLIPDLSSHPPHFSRRNTLYIMHCLLCYWHHRSHEVINTVVWPPPAPVPLNILSHHLRQIMLIPRNTSGDATNWINTVYYYFATFNLKRPQSWHDDDFSELWIWHLSGEMMKISDGADINGKKPLSQWWSEASFSENVRRECKCENPWDTRLVVLHSRDSWIVPIPFKAFLISSESILTNQDIIYHQINPINLSTDDVW